MGLNVDMEAVVPYLSLDESSTVESEKFYLRVVLGYNGRNTWSVWRC